MALKTLPDCPEFYNAPNVIKSSKQTTNLEVMGFDTIPNKINGP